MLASEHFVNVVYGFATSCRAAIANPSFAVCFEVYIEKLNDDCPERLLVLIIKGTHIHSTKVSQVKKMISYSQLLSSTVANDMCKYFVNEAFNEMELFLNNDLLARAKHIAKEESNEQ